MKERKEVINKDSGQKTITGKIILKEDTKFLNNANYGKTPFDWNWNKNDSIIIKAGTEVNYRGQETRSYFLHEVWIRVGSNIFNAHKTDENHLCTK